MDDKDEAATTASCPQCGRPVDSHDRHVRFRVPDPVLAIDGWQKLPGVWLSHEDPDAAVMMQVPGAGPFVRCVLPIHIEHGYHLTFGVWIGVSPDDLQHAFAVWWEPAYEQLTLNGVLANALPHWGMFAAPVTARVRNPEHAPYVDSSPDPEMCRVLLDEWPYDEVLASLPT